MNLEDILAYLDEHPDDAEIVNHHLKNRTRPARVNKSTLIKDDIIRLSEVLPKASTRSKGHMYEHTVAYFVRVLRDLADVALHSYAVKYSTRGFPVWNTTEAISDYRADAYADTFHALTDTLLSKIEEYGTTYGSDS